MSFQAGTGSGTRCCGPRGGTAVRMEQKTRSNFLPWPGQTLGPWHLAAADVATRLPHTPPFSRLLRHAGGYSRTILTPNLQGLDLLFTNCRNFYSLNTHIKMNINLTPAFINFISDWLEQLGHGI